jgi:hypothetical protein
MASQRQRALDIGLELEVHRVSDVEGPLGPSLISLVLDALLGSMEVVSDRRKHSSAGG